MTCSNCNQPLDPGAAFCGNCGQPILRAEALDSNSVQQTRPPVQAPLAGEQLQSTPITQSHKSSGTPVSVASTTPQDDSNLQTPVFARPESGFTNLVVPVSPSGIPSYAVPVASQQSNDLKAAMAVVVGILGIIAALFIPIIGLTLGIGAVVLATLSRQAAKKGLHLAGLIIGILAIIVGVASWAYTIAHDPRLNHKTTSSSPTLINGPTIMANNLTTACYKITFKAMLSIQNNQGSCNMDAYNGTSVDDSTNVYKVYGTVSDVSSSDFLGLSKQAIEKDITQTLPNFTINNEHAGSFAKSQTYFVTASNDSGVSVLEAITLHPTSSGDNFFVFVHATTGKEVNLNDLQAGWQWQ